MPSTFLGLVLFVTAGVPGLCFYIRRDTRKPERGLSPAREAVSLVLVSLTCDVVVLTLFSAIRSVFPGATPDIRLLILKPVEYAAAHVSPVWWWSTGLVAAASGLGFWLGGFDQAHDRSILGLKVWKAPLAGRIEHMPAWFRYYNGEHRHSGIGYHTPASVHYGTAVEIRERRAEVLEAAYAANPQRFGRGRPTPPKLPKIAWINEPQEEVVAQNA